MKKIILSGAVILTFIIYVLHERYGLLSDRSEVIAPNSLQTNSPSNNQQIFTTSQPSSSIQTSGSYKDGSYTGNVADAFYGNIQVKAVISGGKITDVVFLQYPNDRSTSVEINTQAMPLLKEEAITAQSAQVDGVSGATQSSRAFVESLGSALQKAR